MTVGFEFGWWAMTTIMGGVLGNRFDAAFLSGMKAVLGRLRESGSPVNHDIQRAVRKAQLQATILVLEALRAELQSDVHPWLRAAQQVVSPDEELRWAREARRDINAELRSLSDAEYLPPPSEAGMEPELLLLPPGDGGASRARALRAKLVELTVSELKLRLPNPPVRFLSMMREGWDDPHGASAPVRPHWFDAVCAFFAYELKNNQPLANIFQSQVLVELKYDGRPLTHDVLLAQLGGLSAGITARLDRIDGCLAEIKEAQAAGFDGLDERLDAVVAAVAALPDAVLRQQSAVEGLREEVRRACHAVEEGQKQTGDELRESLSESREELNARLVRAIPISGALSAQLEVARAASREVDLPFRTPNLLLLLLEARGGLAVGVMNGVSEGLGDRLRRSIRRYVDEEQRILEGGNRFVPFDWLEREDVRLAQKEAFDDGYPVVTEKYLLLGVLQADSNTSRFLRGELRDKFQEVLDAVRSMPTQAAGGLGTPLPPQSAGLL